MLVDCHLSPVVDFFQVVSGSPFTRPLKNSRGVNAGKGTITVTLNRRRHSGGLFCANLFCRYVFYALLAVKVC